MTLHNIGVILFIAVQATIVLWWASDMSTRLAAAETITQSITETMKEEEKGIKKISERLIRVETNMDYIKKQIDIIVGALVKIP